MSKSSSVVAVSDVLDEPVVKSIISKPAGSSANTTRSNRPRSNAMSSSRRSKSKVVVLSDVPSNRATRASGSNVRKSSSSSSSRTNPQKQSRAQEYRDRLTNAKSASEAKLEEAKAEETHASILAMLSGTGESELDTVPTGRNMKRPKSSMWCFNGICSSKKASVYSAATPRGMNAGKTRRHNRRHKKRTHSSRR